ncbi:MAG: hypothetical protein IJD57_02840 [Candidatus Gastranaerophilales bacterium]|nr:hypothetical protein [Candidatus Gastranaerophilales bacterium]
MGKCKKRTLYKNNSSYFMTREEAINNVFKAFCQSCNKKTNYKNAMETISLFGLSAEELSEAGLSYENLRALGSAIN